MTREQIHQQAKDMLLMPEASRPKGMTDVLVNMIVRATETPEALTAASHGMPEEFMLRVMDTLLKHGEGSFDKLKES